MIKEFFKKKKRERKLKFFAKKLSKVEPGVTVKYILNKNTKERIKAILGEDINKYEMYEVPESICPDGEIFEIIKQKEEADTPIVYAPFATPDIDPKKYYNVCWKCGKKLNNRNRSSVEYLSFPPKYTCKECEKCTR